MTTVKIYKDARKCIRKGKHRVIWSDTHDSNLIRVIQRMRRLGMRMIKYDEATYPKFTLLQFEKKGNDNAEVSKKERQ